MAGEARSRKSSSAASSRAHPGAVTKARDWRGQGWRCLQLPGDSVCASQVPSITTNPDGATCPNCQGPDGHSVASQG